MSGARIRLAAAALPGLLGVAGCEGAQSALTTLGAESDRVTLLSWIMFAGGGAILALVCGLTAIALFGPDRWTRHLRTDALIIGGGIVFPAVTLTLLLFYGFAVLGAGASTQEDEDALRIRVVGEQWWWRVEYEDPAGGRVVSANEIRIPTNQPVRFELTSADVIHSFWIPAYAGKVDMIPGRTTSLRIVAREPGVVRGQCAEYCGGAHALMAFYVIAMEPPAFEAWLARERADAVETDETEGLAVFIERGCGGCHAIRGLPAAGVIGPDLTHVGGRRSLAAGTLPNTEEAFAAWIADHRDVKPENRMPPYDLLTADDVAALARFLDSLE